MKINDDLPNDLVVRDVEIDIVVSAQPGGTPVDLHHFGETFADLEPVTDFVWSADLQRNAGDNAAEKILTGETNQDGCDSRGGQKPGQPAAGVVAVPKHTQESD